MLFRTVLFRTVLLRTMPPKTAPLSVLAPLLLASALLTSAAAVAKAPNDNWPGFRRDGSGVALADVRIPLDWTGEQLLWKTAIEGAGHSSPAVWGDRVFLTTAIEGGEIEGAQPPPHKLQGMDFRHPDSMAGNKSHTMKVIALDAETGAIRWSQTAYSGRVYDDRHRQNTYASPSPVTDGERVYAYFGSEGVYAYDFDGEPVWQANIGNIKSVGLGVGTSPVLWRNLLIIQADEDSGDDSFIIALDKSSGRVVWRKDRTIEASFATPILVERDDRAQLIAPGAQWIISYDPATGAEHWRATGLVGTTVVHTPYVHDDLVIFSAGYPTKLTIALPLDAEGELDESARVWTYEKGTGYMPTNVLYDGILYLTNDGGVLTALDATSGAVLYEGGRVPIRGRYTASLLGVDGKILMLNQDGDAAFVKAGPEHEVLATTSVDEPVWATPAIVGNRIYVRGTQHLFAIGAE